MNDLEPKEITEKETITVQEDFKPVEKAEIQEIQSPIIAPFEAKKDKKESSFSFSSAFKIVMFISFVAVIVVLALNLK